VTKYSANFEIGDSKTERFGDNDRPIYQHWWQEALAEVQQVSIATWAQKVVEARCLYETRDVPPAQRTAWQKQAIGMALYGDERANVGGWSPAECVAKARMSYEQVIVDPNRPRDIEALRQGLREFGNPNKQFFCRDMLAKLGERMLAQCQGRQP
jgi:hypothetical protein